jgi:hypothetical protein
VFDSVSEAAHAVRMELRNIADMAVTLKVGPWALDNLNLESSREPMRIAGLDEAEIDRRLAAQKRMWEDQIAAAESFLAGANERFGPGFTVTGSVVEKDAAGNWQMGDFSITSKGGGFALKLDRENGLMLKDAGGAWRQDSAGTAALRLLEDTLARPPRALDQTV